MTSTDSSDDLNNQIQRIIELNDAIYSVQRDTDHMNDGLKMTLIIHHQFPGIKLVSPVYFSLFATCYPSPDQNVDVGSTMQIDFNIDLTQYGSSGILMYKLQRKNIDQFNMNIISNEHEATCIQLVMIWRVDSSKKFYVNSCLIEHDEDCIWDKVRLMKLAFGHELVDIQHNSVEDTWLMRDHTVLMTSLNATFEKECYKLEMTISKTSINDETQRPQYFDVDR
jgi:hypothetical protein